MSSSDPPPLDPDEALKQLSLVINSQLSDRAALIAICPLLISALTELKRLRADAPSRHKAPATRLEPPVGIA